MAATDSYASMILFYMTLTESFQTLFFSCWGKRLVKILCFTKITFLSFGKSNSWNISHWNLKVSGFGDNHVAKAHPLSDCVNLCDFENIFDKKLCFIKHSNCSNFLSISDVHKNISECQCLGHLIVIKNM